MLRRFLRWSRRRWKILVPALVAGAHVAFLVGAIYSIAFTNPFLRFADREPGWLDDRSHRRIEAEGTDGEFPAYILGEGDRPIVLLVHGRSRRASWMLPLADRLKGDYDICLFDLRHHGDRGLGTTSLGWHEATDVMAVLNALYDDGYSRIAVVGISIGAAASVRAVAHMNQSPEELVEAGVVGVYRELEESPIRALVTIGCFADLAGFIHGQCSTFLLPPYLFGPVRASVESLADYEISRVRPAEEMKHVRTPVLVLHGRNDYLVDPENAEILARNAGTSPVYYDGDHDEPDNTELQEEVASFLARHLR